MGIRQIQIGNRFVGPGAPVFVIAEAGVNHNGDLELARQLVNAAFAAGADAVKFQSFIADELVSSSAPKANYQLQTTDPAESQYEMIKRLELSVEAHEALNHHCQALGIQFLSTPFDRRSADLLQRLGVPAFKVSSGDLTDWPLLDYLARFAKPIILSTGMSYLEEVRGSLEVVRAANNPDAIVLHCVSNYPAADTDANLRAMQTMADELDVPVGFSDHTEGSAIALAAVALGARVIEKHLTLDRNLPGPDHQASLEPGQFKSLVADIRRVESSLGHGTKEPAASESNTRNVARRSLVAAMTLEAGTILNADMLREKRPGTGISPSALSEVVGKKLARRIEPNEMISWKDLL
jgi:N-acetylneuraminate synthase